MTNASSLRTSMIDSPEIRSLGRFLDLSVRRESLIGSNLANIDTPGYHARDVNFRMELQRADDGMQDASLNPILQRVPGLNERPDGNNVSLERETLLLAETQLRFSEGVEILRAAFRRISSAIHEGSPS
jgi:flagellar basal-body rod protein FlgB